MVVVPTAMSAVLSAQTPILRPPADGGEHARELFMLDLVDDQDRGSWQASVKGLILSDRDDSLSTLCFEIQYGLTDRLQLEIGVPAHWRREDGVTESGAGDLELGGFLKLSEEPGLDIFLGGDVSIPTGDKAKELGEGVVTFEPRLSVSAELGKGLYLHGVVGAELGAAVPSLSLGAAVEQAVGRFSMLAELSGEFEGSSSVVYITPGIVWRVSECSELGLGIPLGLTDHAAAWGIVVSLTVEF